MLQCCSSKKKLVRLLKIALSGPHLGKNRASMSHTQNQVQLFSGNNKKRSKAFKNVLFYPNIISFDWSTNNLLSCVIFFCQSKPLLDAFILEILIILKHQFWLLSGLQVLTNNQEILIIGDSLVQKQVFGNN